MVWKNGTYPGTWFTGTGIRRKEVVGACTATLRNGWTHMMRFNSINGFLGIEWSTGTNYTLGTWQLGENGNHQFTLGDAATEEDWNRCWQNINNALPPPPQPESTFTEFTGRYDTPITENLNWRIVAAVAILIITGLYALKLSRE